MREASGGFIFLLRKGDSIQVDLFHYHVAGFIHSHSHPAHIAGHLNRYIWQAAFTVYFSPLVDYIALPEPGFGGFSSNRDLHAVRFRWGSLPLDWASLPLDRYCQCQQAEQEHQKNRQSESGSSNHSASILESRWGCGSMLAPPIRQATYAATALMIKRRTVRRVNSFGFGNYFTSSGQTIRKRRSCPLTTEPSTCLCC